MATELNLRREVTDALVAEGFKRGKRVHLKRVDDDWNLLVDTGDVGKRQGITPWVGIQSRTVERLLQELLDLPAYAFSGTVAANVGYIVDGAFRQWMPPIVPGMPEVSVDEVLDLIRAGLDRLSGYCRLDRLPAAWEAMPQTQSDPSCAYRRVLVQLLLGDAGGVERELGRAEAEYCRRDDEICATFRRFRESVLARQAGQPR